MKRLALSLTDGGWLVIMGSFTSLRPTARGFTTYHHATGHPLWPEACTRASGPHRPGPAALSYLHGVSADDLATEPLAELQRQGGFAGARGPENHYKRQCPLQAPKSRAHRNCSCSRRRRHLEDVCACAGAAVPMTTVSAPVQT